MGQDWILAPGTSAAQYVTRWGSAAHQYMLNKTGGNKFTALPNHLEAAARAMTLSIRQSMTADLLNAVATPLDGPHPGIAGPLRANYARASDAADLHPDTVYAGIRDLVGSLTTVRNTLAYWQLVPPATQPAFNAARTTIGQLRTAYQGQFEGII
jgi:hypothetical protein